MDTRPLTLPLADKQLKRRLLDARALLTSHYVKMFPLSRLTYDYAAKRVYGMDGFYLQWTADHTLYGSVSLWRLPEVERGN